MNTKIALLLSGVITLCAFGGKDIFYAIGLILTPITMFLALWHGPRHAKELKDTIITILKNHYLGKK